MSAVIDVLALAQRYSVNDRERLALLFTEARRQAARDAGDFIELGVFRGGSALLMAQALREQGGQRRLQLLDSWQGLPALSPQDAGTFVRAGTFAASSESQVRQLLAAAGLLDCCELHAGWFEQTLPSLTGPFVLAHVDCDLYEPVKLGLAQLLPRMAAGGTIVVDDYGTAAQRRFPGVATAVHEVLAGSGWRVQPLGGLHDQSVLLLAA